MSVTNGGRICVWRNSLVFFVVQSGLVMGGRNRGVSRPRSLHLNDDAHPEAQRDIIAKLLQVSESSPVIGVKDPLCSRLLGISGPAVKQRRGRRDEAEERRTSSQAREKYCEDWCRTVARAAMGFG